MSTLNDAIADAPQTRVDETTGRTVRILRHEGKRLNCGYFRSHKWLHDGRVMLSMEKGAVAVDPATGETEQLTNTAAMVDLHEATGKAVVWDGHGKPLRLATLDELKDATKPNWPGNWVGSPVAFTCDGRYVILQRISEYLEKPIVPYGVNVEVLWNFFNRPRDGWLWAYDLVNLRTHDLVSLKAIAPIHPDASPTDPTLVKYSQDQFDGYTQRIWTVRIDGSDPKPIRLQQRGEVVTHEFWWPDGSLIGYKYQDRRKDDTVYQLPWCEYSPIATQFGLADLDGKEVYLSDPINSYHSHIFVSKDSSMLCGEGTHDHSFLYAARFDRRKSKIDFQRQATIHTEYVALGGQSVNAGFSPDGRWLIYNDTIDGHMEACVVNVDLA
jgi:hypothetical protein